MRSLPQGRLVARAVYDACATRTQDGQLKERLLACGPSVEVTTDDYIQLGRNQALTQYPSYRLHPFPASTDDMRALYERVLRDGGERDLYEEMLALAPRGVCPQCGVGRVRTLDHYLPKKRFPELAVAPANLVPACRDCNFDKQEYYSNQAKDYIFHPFFDNWDIYALVEAQLHYAPRVHLVYSIGAPQNAPATIIERAKTHFRVLKLAALYAMNAGSALAEIKVNCTRASAAGADAVRGYLTDQERQASVSEPNGWRAAMYRAMAADDGFWGGRYLEI